MPFSEASFWVFLTVFGTSLFFIRERERSDRIFGAACLIIGVIGMVLSELKHEYPNAIPISHDVLIWSGLGITWLFLIYVVSVSRGRAASGDAIHFFQNRTALERTRNFITDELQKHGENFWVMWQVGHLMAHITPEVRKKIHRMILFNPKASKDALDYMGRTADAGTGDNVQARIADATRLGHEAGTSVRYRNEQFLSLVIANPNNTNESGWIRIEYILPFMPPTQRPSILITEKQFPNVFKTFVDAYDKMWADAVPDTDYRPK